MTCLGGNGLGFSASMADRPSERLRIASRQAAEVLTFLAGLVRTGPTTDELDAAAYDECRRRGVYPSTLNYHGYSKSICTSR